IMKATRIAIFAIMLLVSCRPASYEQFIRADQAQAGEYVFVLDLSDSTATYDLSLYTRVDPALMAAATPSAELALQVCWMNPGGEEAASDSACFAKPAMSEIVYLPYGAAGGTVQLYRSGIKPSPAGEWRLTITPMTPPAGLRGLGIICKRND
ncbi:MAG: hypothetical protein IKR30_07605, partial [Bacteroidales bacterium]|nr:hypothetical protein [Bacteroidales bacterium]